MATAKQIAARKLFVKRVRAGEFAGKPAAKRAKKPAAKRAKNPTAKKAPAAYSGKYPRRIKSVSGKGSGLVIVTLNNGEVHHLTARECGGVMPKLGAEFREYEQRKTNPTKTARKSAAPRAKAESGKITHVGMTHNEGLEYGLDSVTPVLWKFYAKDNTRIRYIWRLPDRVVNSAAFQEYARENPTFEGSHNRLKSLIREF